MMMVMMMTTMVVTKIKCSFTGTFNLSVPVDALFFIGSQLVATSHTGKIGVWNSMTQHWQVIFKFVMCVSFSR